MVILKTRSLLYIDIPRGNQVNNLREIQALRRLSPHPGIIKLVEVLLSSSL